MYSATDDSYNYILASVNFINTRILVDTGASRTCISENYLQRIFARQNSHQSIKSCTLTNMLSATGTLLKVLGTIELDIRINNYMIPQTFYVIRNLHHSCILGIDMLQRCHAVIDVHNRLLRLF